MDQQDEQFTIVVKNLDDNSTLLYSASNKAEDIPYTSIGRNHELDNSIWASYWSQVKHIEEEMWDAVQSGSFQKLQEIFDRKTQIPVQVNSESLDKWTALHYACYGGHDSIALFLLSKGANIQAKTSMGRTSLHLACIKQHLNIVKILLAHSADLNGQDDDLCTPLHYAAMYGFEDIVKVLLEEGDRNVQEKRPNLKIKNYQNMTPSDCSLNTKIYRHFSEKNKEEDSYGRMIIGDTMRRNGRADHVEKLLMTTASLHKHNSVTSTQSSQDNSDKKNEYRKLKFQKMSSMNVNITKIKIEEDGGKIGLKAFEIIGKLGKGSFGDVYLVKKKGEEKLYALKSLLKSKIRAQKLTKYVMTEKDVLTLMDNPYIVKIYGAFQTKDNLYLLLEYCPGGDLQRKIVKQKSLPQNVVKIYAAEITVALQSIHKRQVIFRDLKPANVVLDEEGHAKITDFGLAIQSKQSKSFCGSIAYLAPQILFKKRHGFTLDWYLLGVLMYELLHGTPPYYCLNKQRLFENIKHQRLTLPKNITKQCQDILTKLLQRDPSKRLGCQHDSKDIKEHPWFRDIDWKEVYQRKLQPPAIKPKEVVAKKLQFQEELEEESSETRLNGWSFVKTG